MAEFLFIFGYESPEQWQENQTYGTDFESSDAVWVECENEQQALAAGRAYAEKRVTELFHNQPVVDWPGWLNAGYAYWIEQEPFQRWRIHDLQRIPRINPQSCP